jgi:transcriptional regulator with XRE-family HTH domain
MNFLENLEKLSREKGIQNNYQLAEQSGVAYTTLDNFYRVGYENVKLSTLKKLAAYMGCSLDYLADDDIDADTETNAEKPLQKEINVIIAELYKKPRALDIIKQLYGASTDEIETSAQIISFVKDKKGSMGQ